MRMKPWASDVVSIQILSKSKLEKCVKSTDSHHELNCTIKIVINMAVPSGSSSVNDSSIVAEIVEAEENSTNKMQTLRILPVLTVNKMFLLNLKSSLFRPTNACQMLVLTFLRYVGGKDRQVSGYLEWLCRLRDEGVDKLVKRKANTVHCLRFSATCSNFICMSFFMQFDCSKGVALMEEQFFIMKPDISSRSLNSIQQLIKQQNTFVLDSEFNKVDRAECQFSTTATTFGDGSQITPFQPLKASISGCLEYLE
ncbi:protein HAPLESS 2 isoform X1 [Gossypium australe]|uniref:Protein HAPLESS 2 isoform X1 n=1 Tax=Gossypium australe TaxID=47621 RepID=A0A5B6UQP5_9ROSI|nr:protein HAPLESS 2 isoform X1 [Gossypium australe]